MLKPVYSMKVELRDSSIHGKGTFAKVYINKDEIIFVKNGHILSNTETCFKNAIVCDWPLNDKYILGAQIESERDIVKLIINHSCNPNCGLIGLNAGVAMRDIEPGEEITFDYAMLDNEEYSFECHCGSQNCRKKITGFDWMLPELQERYKSYFVNYIQEKINTQM